MATGNKVRGTAVTIPIGITFGVLLSLMYTCILTAVLVWLVLNGKMDEKNIGYFVMGELVTGSALGSLTAAMRIKRRWMIVCFLTGAVFYLTLLAMTAVFFGGNYQGVWVTGLLVLAGILISGMLGLRRNKSKEKQYRKYRTC